MSRTRLIRPEFFADEVMATVSDATRLFYIGLWTQCDDAGYFEHKPRQLAAALYPYRGQASRQRVTDRALAELEAIGRVKFLECGEHGVVPTLPRHGAKGGNKAFTSRERHSRDCDGVGAPTKTAIVPPGKSVSTAVKLAVAERDQDHCRYCGKARPQDGVLLYEHVDNLGLATLDNIVLACRSCNRKKGSKTLEESGLTLLPPPVRMTNGQVRTPSTDKSSSVLGLGMGSDSVSEGAQARGLRDVSKDVGGFAATLAKR